VRPEYNPRVITANHEAGHALAYIELEIPFAYVEIMRPVNVETGDIGFIRTADGLIAGQVVIDFMRWLKEGVELTPEDNVLISMAGLAAEQLDRRRPHLGKNDVRSSAKQDYETAISITEGWLLHKRYHFDSPEAYIKDQFQFVHRLLKRDRPKHTTLVSALLERGRLTYNECMTVVEAAGNAWGAEPRDAACEPPTKFANR